MSPSTDKQIEVEKTGSCNGTAKGAENPGALSSMHRAIPIGELAGGGLPETWFVARFSNMLQRRFEHRPVGEDIDLVCLIPLAAELPEDHCESCEAAEQGGLLAASRFLEFADNAAQLRC